MVEQIVMVSVVDDGCVFAQKFFCFMVELTGYLMNLVFVPTFCAPHADTSTHTMHFKFATTFFTFHSYLTEQLFAGKK